MPKIKSTSTHKIKRNHHAIPFIRGFRPPSKEKCCKAINLRVANAKNLLTILTPNSIFQTVPQPQSVDDWLAQYKELGQTFDEFCIQTPWLSRRKRKCLQGAFYPSGSSLSERYPECHLFLQPIETVDETNGSSVSPSVDKLAEFTKIYLGLSVVVLQPIKLEQQEDGRLLWSNSCSTFDKRDGTRKPSIDLRRSSSGKIQLSARSILKQLSKGLPKNAFCMIGITMQDLYDDDPDLFVAGLAAGNHRVAVFSFFRYIPRIRFSSEFWYDVRLPKAISKTTRDSYLASKDASTHLLRSCRLLVHEAAHLLGFDHCIYYQCCMNGSGHLKEDFRQPLFLCPVDLHKLHRLCNVDLIERYRRLLAFCKENDFVEETAWLKRRLAELSKIDSNPAE